MRGFRVRGSGGLLQKGKTVIQACDDLLYQLSFVHIEIFSQPAATSVSMLGPEAMRKELVAIPAKAAVRFNMNFFCHVPPKPDPGRKAAGRRLWQLTTSKMVAVNGAKPIFFGPER